MWTVVELWDSNSHVTQEHMEREWKESKLGGSRLSVLSAFTLFTVYSYKVVLAHSAVVTLHSPAIPSTGGGAGEGGGGLEPPEFLKVEKTLQ